MNKAVDQFIQKFKEFEQFDVLHKTFIEGFCYYFAVILNERFTGEILYDPIDGHFLFSHHSRLYDIRGDVTELYATATLYSRKTWMSMPSIVQGCIMKWLVLEEEASEKVTLSLHDTPSYKFCPEETENGNSKERPLPSAGAQLWGGARRAEFVWEHI